MDFNIIGDNQRKSRYDPNLADELVKDLEAQERRDALESRRASKQAPQAKPSNAPKLIVSAGNQTYQYLAGDFGKAIDEEIQKIYKGIEAITKIRYNSDKDAVIGTNCFYAVAVNEVLRVQNSKIRTATQADLENMLKQGDPLEFKGNHWTTSALVLRTEDDPNSYLAGHLMAQVKSRLGKNAKMPVMIPLSSLSMKKDSKSDYKLAFNLADNAELIYSSVFNSENGSKFSETDENGLPILDKKGNRTLYTRDSGLSRLDLYGDLDVISYSDDIAYSNGYGRVVCVSAEGTAPKN